MCASTLHAVEGCVCDSPHFLLWRELLNLKWRGGRKGVKWKKEASEGERVGLKTWTGRLETGDRGMSAYWH